MNSHLILAKRYAAAFVNIYDEQLDLPVTERFEQAACFFKDNPSARLVLKLSTIHLSEQRECLAAVCAQYRLPESLLRLVDLLSDQNRLALFPAILHQISELYRVRHNIMAYQISSAEKLDPQALAVIVGFLEKLSGKKIISTEKIDQSLIAGIRLQSDTTLWEYSIQKQLDTLQHQFNV